MRINFCVLVLIVVALSGCINAPDLKTIPVISYNSIQQSTVYDESGNKLEEKVTITINFEDGDGDLGVAAEERGDTQKYKDWGDYELVTMTKALDGSWTETIRSVDRFKFMPILKTDGKPGPIKGKLDLITPVKYTRSGVPVTRKFKIRIRDRALNISNQTAETDTIVVPDYQ